MNIECCLYQKTKFSLYCVTDNLNYKQLASCQLFSLVSVNVSCENVTIPSHVNSMTRANITHGNATSRLVEVQISTGNFGNQHMKYCVAPRVDMHVKMKL